MVLLTTPQAELGSKAIDFNLPGVDGKYYTLKNSMKKNGLIVMFICNHCPYVKAILPRLKNDIKALHELEVGVVSICANDPENYPEDNFENMKKFAMENKFDFPYLQDLDQTIAKAYGAVCTPDFFGFNANGELQYRGRLDEGGKNTASPEAKRELVEAMRLIVETKKGPKEQQPSMGCSIKWKEG